jgi:hypothetical protein
VTASRQVVRVRAATKLAGLKNGLDWNFMVLDWWDWLDYRAGWILRGFSGKPGQLDSNKLSHNIASSLGLGILIS